MSEKSFLGRGWSFPPSFDLDNREVEMVGAAEDIDQSLHILLSTSLGERVLQPEYGCNLQDFQFEPMNPSLLGYLRDVVETALLYHEPRIRVENVSITESDSFDAIEGKLLIAVDYFIRGTNSRFNFVYDFYLKEGIPQ
ncbi:MAG: GPW/gp25 family protein [Saprospiraceae bacterium]|nr:GPW/gp25 family protein [Lewinella sp.]